MSVDSLLAGNDNETSNGTIDFASSHHQTSCVVIFVVHAGSFVQGICFIEPDSDGLLTIMLIIINGHFLKVQSCSLYL